jgi:benzoyl-CoA reductase subunit D
VCAVLAETDVINMVSRGLTTGDILRAIHLSIGGRLVRLLRSAGAEGVVALSGGLAKDEGLVQVLRELVDKEQVKGKKRLLPSISLETHDLAPFNGALGAALLGAYRFDQLQKKGRVEVLASAPA